MNHEVYMSRCLELARLGAGFVAPNPMVGAVLVYEDRIIAEGYHQIFGGPHAEVNCINSVTEKDQNLVSSSILYVSLEPCAHFGKTAPCSDLVIKHKIPKVIIGCRDPFKEVDGKGIEKMKSAGVEVECGVLENKCKEMNKRFFTFHNNRRPYIILKWAQTADRKIAGTNGNRLLISNEFTNRLVHKWRSEEAAILVGTTTALADDPELTNRLWNGPSPIRLVIDMDLCLSKNLHLFDGNTPTIIFNNVQHDMEQWKERKGVGYYQVNKDVNLVLQLCNALYQLDILSVLVEGGAKTLQSFIDEGIWDEARVIVNNELSNGQGLEAPDFPTVLKISEQKILSDTIEIYKPGA